MRLKKKIFVLGATTALAVSLLGGCGANIGSKTTSSGSSSANAVSFHNTTLQGVVTAVDGNTVTLSLANGRGGIPQEGFQGQNESGQMPPEKTKDSPNSQGTANDTGDQNPPEMPDKENVPQDSSKSIDNTHKGEKSGNMPTGDSSMNTTTFTLIIKDESVLEDITLSDIADGTYLTITFGEDGIITSITTSDTVSGAPGEMNAEPSTVSSGTGATTITTDTEDADTTYFSDNDDENALRVEGSVAYNGTNLTLKKSGDTSNTESSDFYGLNAGFLALDGASATITGSTISTDARGANGIFAYGEGSTITVNNTSITTLADNSGGIDVTDGASIEASNLNIETNGQSSAAIRSDRGGGTLTVTNGTYTTNGTGSPAIYCTADITVSDATLNANASEGIVIEGQNPVTLKDCDVTGNMQGTYQGDENENLHTIMVYQSMSGDAEEGEANLTITGGSITGLNGDLIYSTNTTSIVTLEDVALTLSNDTLLRIEGNNGARGWGNEGSNGADMSLYATSQTLQGKIIVDEISSLILTLSENSTFEGSINEEQEGGTVAVTLNDDSTWTLTGDSYITSFEGSLENVNQNGHTLYVNGVAQQ